jgi:hypothetical protein
MSCVRVVNEGLAIKKWLFLEAALSMNWAGPLWRLDPWTAGKSLASSFRDTRKKDCPQLGENERMGAMKEE